MPSYIGNDSYTQSTIRQSGAVSTQFSPDGSLFYVATSDGRIVVYDTATGSVVNNWNAGGTPGGISLSEDGSTLYVVIQGGDGVSAGLIKVIDTATGARSNIRADTEFYDIEVVDADTAIVTGPQGYIIDLGAGTLSPIDLADYSSGSSVLVEDGHLTLIAEPGVSNGPLAIFDDRTNTVTATGDNYQSNVNSGFNWGHRRSARRPASWSSSAITGR